MKEAIAERLRAALGAAAVERDPVGLPRAIPESEEAVRLVCRTAQEEGWKIRVEGRASGLPPDAPADPALRPGAPAPAPRAHPPLPRQAGIR